MIFLKLSGNTLQVSLKIFQQSEHARAHFTNYENSLKSRVRGKKRHFRIFQKFPATDLAENFRELFRSVREHISVVKSSPATAGKLKNLNSGLGWANFLYIPWRIFYLSMAHRFSKTPTAGFLSHHTPLPQIV